MTDSEVPEWLGAGGPNYAYVQVADHVAARIAAGALRAGAMLPNERAMAEEYGVAIGTARRAVEELRARGLVVTLPGKGTFVSTPADTADNP
ncbi:MAG TPA: winged helix-turn-helix domain-containing protein [Trebonia sp.]